MVAGVACWKIRRAVEVQFDQCRCRQQEDNPGEEPFFHDRGRLQELKKLPDEHFREQLSQ